MPDSAEALDVCSWEAAGDATHLESDCCASDER